MSELTKIKVWNLMQVERHLREDKEVGDAWVVRQILDILAPNWREIEGLKGNCPWNTLIIKESENVKEQ